MNNSFKKHNHKNCISNSISEFEKYCQESNQKVSKVSKKEKFAPSKSELVMQAAEALPNKLMEKIFDHYSE